MKLARLFTGALALFTVVALSYGASSFGIGGGGSVSDPYYLYPTQNQVAGTEPFTDIAGRTPAPCVISAAKVFVFIGQSLAISSGSDTYAATQANNVHLNIANGGCYAAKQPALGVNISGGLGATNTGLWSMRMVDTLIANGKITGAVSVYMGVGGTTIAQWADNSAAPYLRDRFASVGRRLTAAGLTCTATFLNQGEQDTLNGTSQSAYAASLATVIAAAHAALPCPMFVAQETDFNGTTSTGVRAAQAASWNGTTVLQGADMDTIPGGERYDGTHLNATGAADAASITYTKVVAGLGL